jgi:sarcosine oxidase subunit beta
MSHSPAYDFVVLGGGVIGTSIAFHLARLNAGSVLLVERDQIASGCTAKSSAIIRTHYSIPTNSALACRSLSRLGGR